MKGIVFTGDSFTWGQGLYFYSNLDDIYYPKNCEFMNFSSVLFFSSNLQFQPDSDRFCAAFF